MYAAGAEHPHKAPSVSLLRSIAMGEIDAAVDAEVLQEILHRYRAIRRWDEGREVYALARRIVPLVVAITDQIVGRARDLLDGDSGSGLATRCTLRWCSIAACGASAVTIGIDRIVGSSDSSRLCGRRCDWSKPSPPPDTPLVAGEILTAAPASRRQARSRRPDVYFGLSPSEIDETTTVWPCGRDQAAQGPAVPVRPSAEAGRERARDRA
jgi:hypothetical protein